MKETKRDECLQDEKPQVVLSRETSISSEISEDSEIEGGYVEIPLDAPGVKFSFRTFWKYLGPGWLMSLAYIDPGNLEADLQAGAQTKYRLLWVLLLAHIFGLILQVLAVRLGAASGSNLAQVCRKEYSRGMRNFLWIMTEIAIIGSDVQEVLGTAIALHVLFGWKLWVGAIVTGLDTFTFLIIHRCGTRYMELVICLMISLMAGCFFYNFVEMEMSVGSLMKGFVPDIPSFVVFQMVSMIGAVIMPHNIYLHSALVQSRKIDRRDDRHVRQANKYLAWDSAIALVVSFLINLVLLAVFTNFYSDKCATDPNGPLSLVYDVDSSGWICGAMTLDNAAFNLGYLKNGIVAKIFACGVLAAGQASTLTGTFAGQYVMEGFMKWEIPMWQRTLITRLISLGPAVGLAVWQSNMGENASNSFGMWLNILQSVQLPFALLPVLKFTSSEKIMGPHTISYFWRVICWIMAIVVIIINIFIVQHTLTDPDNFAASSLSTVMCCFGIFITLYIYAQYLIVKEEVDYVLSFIRSAIVSLGKRMCAKENSETPETLPTETITH